MGAGWTAAGANVGPNLAVMNAEEARRLARMTMIVSSLALNESLSARGTDGAGGIHPGTTSNPGATAGSYTITVKGDGNDLGKTTASAPSPSLWTSDAAPVSFTRRPLLSDR